MVGRMRRPRHVVHWRLVEVELGQRAYLFPRVEQVDAVVVHGYDCDVVFVVLVPGDSDQLLVGLPQDI